MQTWKRQHGATLIEQLMGLSVIIILAGLAVPAMGNLMQRASVRATSDSLMAALRHARQTAVFTNTTSLFCPSRDGRHCSRDAQWQQGWLIGQDRDHDGQPDSLPVAVGAAMPDSVRVIGSRARVHIRFRADGSAPGSNVSLLVCRHGRTEDARRVVLANSGRVRVTKATPAQSAACVGT